MKRIRILALVSFLAGLTPCHAAQTLPDGNSSSDIRLSDFQSGNPQVRSKAYEAIRNEPVALRRPAVRIALVNLLDRETRYLRMTTKPVGEGYVRDAATKAIASIQARANS